MIGPTAQKHGNLLRLRILAVLVFFLIVLPHAAHAQGGQCWEYYCGDSTCWAYTEPPGEWWDELDCPIVQRPDQEAKTWTEYLAEIGQYLKDNWQYILEDAMHVAGTTTMLSAMGIQTQVSTINAQATVDGQRQANLAHTVGNITSKTTVSSASQTCPTAKGNQAKASALSAGQGMGQAIQSFEEGVNAGTNANGGSAASASAEVNDLCQLGFLMKQGTTTSRYGTLPSNKGCKDPSGTGKYVDADMRIASVIDQLQFPLPSHDHVAFTKDGHVSFSQGTGGQVNPQPNAQYAALGAEMDFVSAFKFCEHLAPGTPTPTVNGGTPVAADNVNIKNDRDFEALRTAAADECFRALWYRTSCPESSAGTLKDINGSSADCVQDQLYMCQRLVWQAPNGLGLTMSGHDPRFQVALANCAVAVGTSPTATGDTSNFQGLSPAMYDAIMAHKCDDPYYTSHLAQDLADFTEAEHANQFDCVKQVQNYEAMMERERQRLEYEVRNMLSMRGMGAPASQTSRISQ